MKKKVLFSIIGIALFAVAIGFGFQENNRSEIIESNIAALQNAEAVGADCLSCNTAPDCFCYLAVGHTTDNAYCGYAVERESGDVFTPSPIN